MNLKTLKLLELTGTTLKAISADAGITRATLYNNLRDDAVPTLRFALKLEGES
jgi:DNA-binding phage protein